MLEIEVGDIFNALMYASEKGQKCALVHGCDTSGKMNGNISKIVKRNYPYAFIQHQRAFKQDGLKLGSVIKTISLDRAMPTIYNAITQEQVKPLRGNQIVFYDAIVASLQAVANDLPSDTHLHLPAIGCDTTNGDSKRLLAIFQAVFYNSNATLWLNE